MNSTVNQEQLARLIRTWQPPDEELCVAVEGLQHFYGAGEARKQVLFDNQLRIGRGEIVIMTGPSGSGKTTLLNIISGLLIPSEGQVLFDGRDVTRLPTEQRNIAQVFQFPVVYDTMSVYDNLAFPLRNRRVDADEIRKRVEEIADALDLTKVLQRRAQGLDADVKQKISLGRGLVRSDVAAILFDEPLTVIDPYLKWQLRRKLKQIHHELKLTLVYVTHDQVEAMTLADTVVVMNGGQIEQVGATRREARIIVAWRVERGKTSAWAETA
mgnify:CR=1 FL=1